MTATSAPIVEPMKPPARARAGLVGALALDGLPVTYAAAAVRVYHAIAFWIPKSGAITGDGLSATTSAADLTPTAAWSRRVRWIGGLIQASFWVCLGTRVSEGVRQAFQL